MNLKQIKERLAAMEIEVRDATDPAAIDKLAEEKKELLTREKELEDAQQRAETVQALEGGNAPMNVFERTAIKPTEGEVEKEYRTAFLKHLRNINLTEKETSLIEERTMTTADGSAGAVIPTMTANKIIEKIGEYAPMLDEIEMLRVKGNVTIPAEGTTIEAKLHEEGETIASDDDTLNEITLTSYEITKLVTISGSVRTMSIEAFETWLVRKLAREISKKIVNYIFYGTGTNQPQGINAITWNAENSVTVAASASLTPNNVTTLVGLLNGGYDDGAKIYMSKATFFADFHPLMDSTKNNIVREEAGKYYVLGYEVVRDERITLHEAFLGNAALGYVGNLNEDVNVMSQFIVAKKSFDFLGSAIFDGKVSAVEAWVKLIKGE